MIKKIRFYSTIIGQLTQEDVSDRMLKVVKGFDKVDASKITPMTHFQRDLGLDSLDVIELLLCVEDEFAIEIPDEALEKMDSVPSLIQFILNSPRAK